MRISGITLLVGLLLSGAEHVAGQTVRFTEVVDTDTLVPGGAGTFSQFADVRDFDGHSVVFRGFDAASRDGLYAFRDDMLSLLVNEDTPVPGTGTTFSAFFDVALEDETVAFTAGWSGGSSSGCQFSANEGVFAQPLSGGSPLVLADSSLSAFLCFHGVDLDQGRVVVTGGNNAVDAFHNHQEAVLRVDGIQSLTILVDVNTPVPGGGGALFVGFDQEVALRGEAFAVGEIVPNAAPTLAGIYLNDGTLRVVADASTPIPGGAGTFVGGFTGMNYDGMRAAFKGLDVNRFSGLYVGTGPLDLEVAVDRNTRVPGTPFNFLGFSNPLAYTNGCLAFSGFWAGGGLGLFVWNEGRVVEVLVKGDVLDGRVVEQAFCASGQLVGNRMLVDVRFDGFTVRGLYLAELPLPCVGDIDGDGVVGINDLLALLAAWGTPDGDINGDGTTSIDDLLILLAEWGACP